MIHAANVLLCGLALACAAVAIVAYAYLPWEAPMYTGFNGIPSRERVPKIAYLIGIIPLVMLTSLFTLSSLANPPGLPHRLLVAKTVGDVLVLLLAWWGAAMVWNIAEAASGRRERLPRLVMPYGPYAIVVLIVLGGALFALVR
jgi:uncharacterized membrane protein